MKRQGKLAFMRENYDCEIQRGGCGATKGQFCITRSGTPTESVHAARWDQYLDRPLGPNCLNARVGYLLVGDSKQERE